MVGYNRFSNEFQKASKELREGKKSKNANKGCEPDKKSLLKKSKKHKMLFRLVF